MEYVELSKQDQVFLLKEAKIKKGYTWERVANELGVNRSMVFLYVSGSRIPQNSYMKLCELAERNPVELKFSLVSIREKKINEPALSHEFANFLGILAGDGHMNDISHEVTITGHKTLDREFMEEQIAPMIERLFNLRPYIRYYEHCMICRVYSKRLVEYFAREFSLPVGKKTGRLHIPTKILGDNKLLKSYIRGLYDTDGSVYRHHKKSIALDITSADPVFREEVASGLRKLGFNPTINGKNIQIYRKAEIDSFFKIIEPMNKRHLNRYQAYCKFGYLLPQMRL